MYGHAVDITEILFYSFPHIIFLFDVTYETSKYKFTYIA